MLSKVNTRQTEKKGQVYSVPKNQVSQIKSNQIIKSNPNLSCLSLSIHSPSDPTPNPHHPPILPPGENTWALRLAQPQLYTNVSDWQEYSRCHNCKVSLINTSIWNFKKQLHGNPCLFSLQKFRVGR